MKKMLTLVLALAAAVALTMTGPGRAIARAVGTWEFQTLNLNSDQAITNAGTLTQSGTATFSGTTNLSGAVNPTSSWTQGTAGTQNLNGSGTAGTVGQVLGLFATKSVTFGAAGQNTGVNISTTVPVNSSYELLISSGNNLLMTSTPSVSTNTVVGGVTVIPDGTFLVLSSTDTKVITFQSNGQLSGSLLKLGAATRAVTQYKYLTLQFGAADGMWHEVAYASDAN